MNKTFFIMSIYRTFLLCEGAFILGTLDLRGFHLFWIGILFVDFTKAFDMIDHNILLDKFIGTGIPEHVAVVTRLFEWSIAICENW